MLTHSAKILLFSRRNWKGNFEVKSPKYTWTMRPKFLSYINLYNREKSRKQSQAHKNSWREFSQQQKPYQEV